MWRSPARAEMTAAPHQSDRQPARSRAPNQPHWSRVARCLGRCFSPGHSSAKALARRERLGFTVRSRPTIVEWRDEERAWKPHQSAIFTGWLGWPFIHVLLARHQRKKRISIGFQADAQSPLQYSTGSGSRLRQRYQVATERQGRQRSPYAASVALLTRSPAK